MSNNLRLRPGPALDAMFAAMREDEDMRAVKPSGIERLRAELDLAPGEAVPFPKQEDPLIILPQ